MGTLWKTINWFIDVVVVSVVFLIAGACWLMYLDGTLPAGNDLPEAVQMQAADPPVNLE